MFNVNGLRLSGLGFISVLSLSVACSPSKNFDSKSPRLRESPVEPGYLMPPESVELMSPHLLGRYELAKIVRLGARIIEWTDLLQAEIAPEMREQLWRKQDYILNQPTADRPRVYNTSSIEKTFEAGISLLHRSVLDALDSYKPLPKKIPHSLKMQDLLPGFRTIIEAYSMATRWILLYPSRESFKKEARDFRPWLKMRIEKDAIENQLKNWSQISAESRLFLIKKIAEGCPIGGRGVDDCMAEAVHFVNLDDPGDLQDFVDHVFVAGEEVYSSRFKIQQKHFDVEVHLSDQGVLGLKYKAFEIPPTLLSWISSQIEIGWSNPGFHQSLVPAAEALPGVIQVHWQEGAMPYVNAVGGDVITMDSNQKLWLEYSQVAMIHEFGHVMGFPDCYSEFWDEKREAFVFYTLDPNNRMCALTGDTLREHWDGIRETYASGSKFLIDLEAIGWPGYE